MNAPCALAVMAKAPRAGLVKTRLVPPLSHTQAAQLGACFLQDTLATVRRATEETGAHGFVCYAPADAAKDIAPFVPTGFTALPQSGATLGARLVNAAAEIFARGYGALCLLGADSPTLPLAFLTRAVALLQTPGERLVIGPADDGGYYLLGLTGAQPQLFAGIAWSTPRVLTQTLKRAQKLRLSVVQLPSWYDVDDDITLRRLCREITATGADFAPQTRYYLQSPGFPAPPVMSAHGAREAGFPPIC